MEWLAAEYQIPFPEAVWGTPLVIAIIMLPVRNERHGGASGPDYVTRAGNAASIKARKFLHENFDIVTKPVTETGWLLGGETQLKI